MAVAPAIPISVSASVGKSSISQSDYRPADEHGPDQNVPLPVKPEDINEETRNA